VNVFTRSLTDELASLVKQIDDQVIAHADQRMKGLVVLLTDDPEVAEQELKAFARKHGIKHVPLTLFDGPAGPPSYRIARKAEVTVNMWVGLETKVNHAFARGELNKDEVDQVVADTAKILK